MAGLSDSWDSKTLSIGGAYGAFGANIIGQVVNTPGQEQWSGLGIGLTWRTPWSGQLTIGADNLVTRGKNPFSPRTDGAQAEGAIPRSEERRVGKEGVRTGGSRWWPVPLKKKKNKNK